MIDTAPTKNHARRKPRHQPLFEKLGDKRQDRVRSWFISNRSLSYREATEKIKSLWGVTVSIQALSDWWYRQPGLGLDARRQDKTINLTVTIQEVKCGQALEGKTSVQVPLRKTVAPASRRPRGRAAK